MPNQAQQVVTIMNAVLPFVELQLLDAIAAYEKDEAIRVYGILTRAYTAQSRLLAAILERRLVP